MIPECLEINCSGEVLCPDLREFDSEVNGGILFEEASLQLIIKQKKIFQAGNKPVKLGQTTSAQFAYEVSIHKTKIIVANNTYEQEIKMLSACDRKWILENSVAVHIKKGDLFDA